MTDVSHAELRADQFSLNGMTDFSSSVGRIPRRPNQHQMIWRTFPMQNSAQTKSAQFNDTTEFEAFTSKRNGGTAMA